MAWKLWAIPVPLGNWKLAFGDFTRMPQEDKGANPAAQLLEMDTQQAALRRTAKPPLGWSGPCAFLCGSWPRGWTCGTRMGCPNRTTGHVGESAPHYHVANGNVEVPKWHRRDTQRARTRCATSSAWAGQRPIADEKANKRGGDGEVQWRVTRRQIGTDAMRSERYSAGRAARWQDGEMVL